MARLILHDMWNYILGLLLLTASAVKAAVPTTLPSGVSNPVSGSVLAIYQTNRPTMSEFDADNNTWCKGFLSPSIPVPQLVKLSEELFEKWKDLVSNQSPTMLRSLATGLLWRAPDDATALAAARQYMAVAIRRVGEAEIVDADLILMKLDWNFGRLSTAQMRLGDLVERDDLLNAILHHIDRAETFLEGVEMTRVFGPMATVPLVPDGVPHINNQPMGPIVDPVLRAKYSANILEHQEWHRVHAMTGQFTTNGNNRRVELPNDLAKIVQTRFTGSSEDLLIVKKAFDKNIKNPELKERLIKAVYGERNPFFGLSEQSTTEPGGPSLADLTRKSAAAVRDDMATGGSRGESPSTSAAATGETPQSTSPRSLPYLPLAGVLAAGVVLWWFISRSRPS